MTRKLSKFSPVQIWTPLISISPFNESFMRDLHRAQDDYQGEVQLFLSPHAKEAIRWSEQYENLLFHKCLIPSEQINAITVYHRDENGRLFPPLPLPDEWEKCLPEALYLKWLSTQPDVLLGKSSIIIDWPRIKDGTVTYRKKEVKLKPGPLLPTVSANKKKRTRTFRWPPQDSIHRLTVSPEQEIGQSIEKLQWKKLFVGGREIDTVASEKDSKRRAINYWFRWPEPFTYMLPPGTFDIVHHYALLKDCIDELHTRNDYEKVLRVAESWVSRLTAKTETTVEAGWFIPKLMADPQTAIWEAQFKFGIDTGIMDMKESLVKLQKSKRFWEIRHRMMEVRRIYGWLGYFWWEFYQDLKANVTIKLCQRCGNIIRGGHADRQYCRKEENPDCYRNHATERQRRSRKRRSGQQKNA